jgi:TetR/AcrR family transcriptional regulator, copper-responsive repressor
MKISEAVPRRRGRPSSFDREAALAAAVDLFWRHGYEGVSISMLTEAMGVTPPTLYTAFGSKQGLYREAVTAYAASGRGGAAPRPARLSPYEIVEAFLHSRAELFTDPSRPPGCMVATGTLRCGLDGLDAAEATTALREAGIERFVRILEAAKQAGDLPPDTDAAAIARFYIAVVQGMSVQAIDGASAADLHRVADAALRAWPKADG